jgi:tetratricopeptide (TPR) repeat protein
VLPNNVEIFKFLGLINRREGRWDEAIRNLERAVDLDPRNASTISDLVDTYFKLRRYEEAIAVAYRALALEPRSIDLRTNPPSIAVDAEADIKPLRAVVNTIEAEGPSSAAEVADISFQTALRERDPAAAARALGNTFPAKATLNTSFNIPTPGMKPYWLNCDKTRPPHTLLSLPRGLKERKSSALNPGVWHR